MGILSKQLISILVCLAVFSVSAEALAQVVLNGIPLEMKAREPASQTLLTTTSEQEALKWIIQFDGPILQSEKDNVTNLGCRLLEYLPDFAFLAAMNDTTKRQVEQLPFVAGIARFEPEYKLSGTLQQKTLSAATAETVTVILQLDDPGSLLQVLTAVQQLGGEVLDVGRDILRVAVDRMALSDLAALEAVIWIEEHFDMQLCNDTTSWVIQTNKPENTAIWAKGLHGEGQTVGIGDTGLDYDMPWFLDTAGVPIGPAHRKIAGYDTTYGDNYDAADPGHGTHVTGTLAGDRTPVDGLSNANGMAPKAKIFMHDLSVGASNSVFPPTDLGLLFDISSAAGARLHSNSWGNRDPSYSTYAASADRFLWDNKDFLAFFANGNTGPAPGTVGNPATAKNIISVGATYNGTSAENLAMFSSNGPTTDGRIKPTVTAPGMAIVSADSDGTRNSFNNGTIAFSGTSMATPALAGATTLVRQYFTDGYYPRGMASPADAVIPSAALLKATVINSAMDMTGTYTDGAIPSTGQGWGRIKLDAALPFAGDTGQLAVTDDKRGLATGESWSKTFSVSGDAPLKATLVWTDYPGAVGAAKALVNDLDLTVTGPGGTVLIGNAFAGGESVTGGSPDRLNVEEQILIKKPASGWYTVSVSGYNVPYGPQPFALVVTGASGVTSRGTISFARKRYSDTGALHLEVTDLDLNVDSTTAEQITIVVASSTEPAGELVVLTETAPSSAVFTGTMPLASGIQLPGDNRLQVANGDLITASYHDANNGSGSSATVTASALVDTVLPVISNSIVTGVTDTSAAVSWESDEPASSAVEYGTTLSMGGTSRDQRLGTVHRLSLAGLQEGVTYYATLISTDEAGNTAKKEGISFKTQSLPPALTVTSSAGLSTSLTSTIISGVSTDPSGVVSVTINGAEAPHRKSDGYYSLSVPLEIGANIITVMATDSLSNTAIAGITITRNELADLYIGKISGPTEASQGEAITITDSVCNNGPGPAGSFEIGYYLSQDDAFSDEDAFIGRRTVPSLAAATCASGSASLTLSPTVPGGTAYLIAVADNADQQAETSETNNALAGNQITIKIPTLPPLGSITIPSTSSVGTIQVSWGASSISGVSYVLEMAKTGGPYAPVYTGAYPWTAVTVSANGVYSFRVKATRQGFNDSPYSDPRTCTVTLTCGIPTSLSVPTSSNTGLVQISWSASTTAGVTYALEMRRDTATFAPVYSGTNAWTAVTLPASGSYSFRVKATKDGYGDSAYSETRFCTVTLICGIPASLSVPTSSSTGVIQISWSASTIAGVTYVLEMSRDTATFAPVYSGTNAWTAVTVPASGSYNFRVKATKIGYGDSAYSATRVCSVTLICGVPGSLSVPTSSSSGLLQISWNASTIAGVTYVLEMSKDTGAFVPAYSGTDPRTTITVATNGTYRFRVKAIKASYADSAYSAIKSCTATLVCGAPATISVPTSSTGTVQLNWGSSNVAGVTYVIEMSRDGGAFLPAYKGTYTWTAIAVPADGTYTFRVKATKAGFADSTWKTSGSVIVKHN